MPESDAANFLRGAVEKAGSEPVRMTVRDLLAVWGYQKRGYRIVALIERELAAHSLTSTPPFQTSWIDAEVTITSAELDSQSPSTSVASTTPEIGLTVSSLRSSSTGIIAVGPQTPLRRTMSVMLRHDYSQLPIMVGSRDVKGAVTWESIAQSGAHDLLTETRNVAVEPEIVRAEEDLLPLVHTIATKGFVLVRQRNNEISGLITASDISEEFLSRTSPFLLLGKWKLESAEFYRRRLALPKWEAYWSVGRVDQCWMSAT